MTCVVPAFNAEAFIGEAVDSVLEQTYERIELIIVDDGSADRTLDVIRSYGDVLTYLRHPHAGAASAKNTGIRAAHGEFVAFLDADDLWRPDKLTRQMRRFAERPEVDLCFTRYRNFWAPDLAEEEKRYAERLLARSTSGWSMSTLLTRRDTFRRFGFFEESADEKHQSLIWALRAAKNGAVVDVMPDVLVDRRLHSGNQSRRWTIDAEFFDLLKTWRDYRKHVAGDDDARPPLG